MPKDDNNQQPSPGAPPPEEKGTRVMTAGERALAQTAFGDRIDYGRVRLCNGPGGNPAAMIAFGRGNSAITLSRTIYFKGRFHDDFSTAPDRDKVLLMHEMTHIWQYRQLGVARFLLRYGVELAKVGLNPNNLYKYDQGRTPFVEATLEAQAEMVGHYKRATLHGDDGERARVAKNLAGSGLYGL
jgi:hypothetical protein